MNRDILFTVFTFLKPEEACKINLTCKMFLEVYKENHLWELYCEKYMTKEDIGCFYDKNKNYFECYNIWFDIGKFIEKMGIGKEIEEEKGTLGYLILNLHHKIDENDIDSRYNVFRLFHDSGLTINNKYVKIMPREIYRLQNLRTITCDNCNMDSLPKELGYLQKLSTICIINNHVRDISQFTNLTNLKHIQLTNNKIDEIPDDIHNLVKLEDLSVGFNKIKKIPLPLCTMINLKRIWLTYNQIEEIPDEICCLINLEMLDLGNNKIKKIPENIDKLVKLTQFFLNDNEITYIPINMFHMKTCFVNLMKNNIENVPDKYKKDLFSDRNILLYGNPIMRTDSGEPVSGYGLQNMVNKFKSFFRKN